jgi:hypothetical protein
MNVLRKLYVGRVRPVLEYGMSAWSSSSQTNFDKIQRVQNSAARIITGSFRSTPVNRIESITGSNRWRTDTSAEYYNRPRSSNGYLDTICTI